MCVDCTSLNKACPKVPFPLPHIDQIIDSTAGCELLSFLFGVPRGMLLGFIVSQRGIEPNPEKVEAIRQMGPIRDLKGVQRVMGCLAALSRFISRLGEKGLPLYRLLRKTERFTWTPEAQGALDRLKESLTHALIFTPPIDG